MNDDTPTSKTPTEAAAISAATARHISELDETGATWRREVLAAFDVLEAAAGQHLRNGYADAALLQVEMLRDLLDYMPDPTAMSQPGNMPALNPSEPARVRSDIIAAGRFIEWMMFRKYAVPAQDIAGIFDWSALTERTHAYTRVLKRVEEDARALLNAGTPGPEDRAATDQPETIGPSHLRLV